MEAITETPTEEKVYPKWHVPSPEDHPEHEEYVYKIIAAYSRMSCDFREALVILDTIKERLDNGEEYPTSIIERFISRFKIKP
jgi:hypothetical protein